jgi:DNA-binding beta-propeller fold protein YncE
VTDDGPAGVSLLNPGMRPAVRTTVHGAGLAAPRGLAVDPWGNAWVADSGDAAVTELTPAGRAAPGTPSRAPSLKGAWGVAVDGHGNVWVTAFGGGDVTELCGHDSRYCPPGAHTGAVLSPPAGFTAPGLRHPAGIAVDRAGDLWVACDNAAPATSGGGPAVDGVVELVGLAAPVSLPDDGPPPRP